MRLIISIYQYLTPLREIVFTTLGIVPHSCKHNPSCSKYTQNAIKRYGTIQGLFLGFVKILKCNPLFK